MQKTPKDIQILRAMQASEMGKGFVAYCERALADLFNPKNLTSENLEAHKVAEDWVRKTIIEPIKLAKALGMPKPGEFE